MFYIICDWDYAFECARQAEARWPAPRGYHWSPSSFPFGSRIKALRVSPYAPLGQ